MSQAFAALQTFLLKSSGLSLDRDKQYLVEARLNPVIAAGGPARPARPRRADRRRIARWPKR